MEKNSQRSSSHSERGGEITLRQELDYQAGLLSLEETAEFENALADSPEYLARLQSTRARVRKLATPGKAEHLAERMRRAFPSPANSAQPVPATGAPVPSLLSRLSAELRALVNTAFVLPSPQLAWCASPSTPPGGAIVDFTNQPDGSLEIRIVSPELGDEGAVLLAEIPPLPPRPVIFRRPAPSSFQAEGLVVLTAEEHGRLPAERRLTLRGQESAV